MSPVTAAVRAWLSTPEGAAPWADALARRMCAQFDSNPEQSGPIAEFAITGAAVQHCVQMQIAITTLIWSGVLVDRQCVALALRLVVIVILRAPGAPWAVRVLADQGAEWDDVSEAVTIWLRALARVVEGASRPQGGSPLQAWLGRAW